MKWSVLAIKSCWIKWIKFSSKEIVPLTKIYLISELIVNTNGHRTWIIWSKKLNLIRPLIIWKKHENLKTWIIPMTHGVLSKRSHMGGVTIWHHDNKKYMKSSGLTSFKWSNKKNWHIYYFWGIFEKFHVPDSAPGRIKGTGAWDHEFWAQMCMPNLLIICVVFLKKHKIRAELRICPNVPEKLTKTWCVPGNAFPKIPYLFNQDSAPYKL